MTGSDPDRSAEPFRGMEYPSLENSGGQQPYYGAPVDYPTGAGLPPPVYPPQFTGAPGYPPAPGYPGGYDPYRLTKPPGTNGQAIAALVCSIAGLMCCVSSIAGLILGVMAMRETKRTGQEGYGLALAGAVLGGLGVAFMVLTLLLYIGLIASGWQWT
ncbi:DUF4190 domain-containing protein [Mycobacterium sp.]|uniref:DUF4190 domain-containing protein n=1 Tax=Mycobacterium sp. TaxID=1785 RepID=UPI002DB2E44B|nr:DUF4190 domain-containing protein [Mycobacterium sp.]